MTAPRYRWETVSQISASGFIAIVRSASEEAARDSIEALIAGGAGVIEVTMTTPGALRLVERFAGDALFGVGTVLSASQVTAAAASGARFVVTPNFSADVIRHALRHGLASVVGCASATEVVGALESGADMIKLFPAEQLGIDYMRALMAPLPWAPFVPTGGITDENARQWLDAGAVAVGVGGKLSSGTPDEVSRKVQAMQASVAPRPTS